MKPNLEAATLQRVVLATDFSPGARKALRRVQYLPFVASAELILAHVVPLGERAKDIEAASRPRLAHEVDTLRTALARLRRSDVVVRAVSPSGTPPVEIVKLARELATDLVVCGRHGAGKMRGLLLGSTAERIAQVSEVPVLVVGTQTSGPFKAPLLAVTADEHARFVLDAALALIPPGSPADVVSAVSVPMEGWLWGGWTTTKEISRLRKLTRDRAEQGLGTVLAPYRDRGIRLRLALREGDPRKVILAAASRKRADLIVVGTHARTGPVRFHLGSVAAFVVRHAPCDVLMVRTPGVTIEGS